MFDDMERLSDQAKELDVPFNAAMAKSGAAQAKMRELRRELKEHAARGESPLRLHVLLTLICCTLHVIPSHARLSRDVRASKPRPAPVPDRRSAPRSAHGARGRRDAGGPSEACAAAAARR